MPADERRRNVWLGVRVWTTVGIWNSLGIHWDKTRKTTLLTASALNCLRSIRFILADQFSSIRLWIWTRLLSHSRKPKQKITFLKKFRANSRRMNNAPTPGGRNFSEFSIWWIHLSLSSMLFKLDCNPKIITHMVTLCKDSVWLAANKEPQIRFSHFSWSMLRWLFSKESLHRKFRKFWSEFRLNSLKIAS